METNLVLTIAVFMALTLGTGGLLLGRRLARLRRENRRLGDELALLQRERRRPGLPPRTADETASGGGFAARLDDVDLKRRLRGGDRRGDVPEKYRLMAAMARRGLVGQELAEELKISPAETEQLVRLAGLTAAPAPERTEVPRTGERAPRTRKRPAGRVGSDRSD